MRDAYVMTGTLSDERTVKLDEPVPITSARVRVTLERIEPVGSRPYADVIGAIWQRQRARAHRAPTREEVDRFRTSERDSWDT